VKGQRSELGTHAEQYAQRYTVTKTNTKTLVLTLTDTGRAVLTLMLGYRSFFIHYMATTPQWVVLQNSMRIEFAHTHLHTTPKVTRPINDVTEIISFELGVNAAVTLTRTRFELSPTVHDRSAAPGIESHLGY